MWKTKGNTTGKITQQFLNTHCTGIQGSKSGKCDEEKNCIKEIKTGLKQLRLVWHQKKNRTDVFSFSYKKTNCVCKKVAKEVVNVQQYFSILPKSKNFNQILVVLFGIPIESEEVCKMIL